MHEPDRLFELTGLYFMPCVSKRERQIARMLELKYQATQPLIEQHNRMAIHHEERAEAIHAAAGPDWLVRMRLEERQAQYHWRRINELRGLA